jgi:hypothetical protein
VSGTTPVPRGTPPDLTARIKGAKTHEDLIKIQNEARGR